jgi:hypothetical protein
VREELKKGCFHLGMKRCHVHGFFCNLKFSSEEGIFVTIQPQNDVILPILSILTVLSNGGGQIVRN